MELVGGMLKVLKKGKAEPDAVRFQVPQPDGSWSAVTWGQLLDQSRRVALWLDHHGVTQDVKVAIFAGVRVEWACCTLGIEASRGVFVPVHCASTPSQVSYVVNHSDAEILITELALLPKVLAKWSEFPRLRRVVVWDLHRAGDLERLLVAFNQRAPVNAARAAPQAAGVSARLTLADITPRLATFDEVLDVGGEQHRSHSGRLDQLLAARRDSDLAAIIYTPGTTGYPKGVMLTLGNLVAAARSWHQALEHAFPAQGARRDILSLPGSHLSGWGLLSHGTTYDYETWLCEPAQLLELLPRIKPTTLLCPPAAWETLYHRARNTSPIPAEQHAALRRLTGGELTLLLSGGAGLKREVKALFRGAGMPLIEGYGLTECSPNLTFERRDAVEPDSVGKPMPGVELQLATDGEILVKGGNVFAGYYKDPAETRACFDDKGWFHTGDLGQLTDEGFLQLIGRKKEIIATSGGAKISPAAVEIKFVGNPFIEHIVLFGDAREHLVALVTLDEPVVSAWAEGEAVAFASYSELVQRPEVRAVVQRAIDAVNAGLAPCEEIRAFDVLDGHLSVEAGHLTPSLKLRRQKVWRDFEPRFAAMYA